MGKPLGAYLRRLRKEHSKSLKVAGPELGLSYSYLSKLENGHLEPSRETIESLASYYDVDAEQLAVLAGKLPHDVLEILQGQPEEAIRLLRKTFGRPDKAATD